MAAYFIGAAAVFDFLDGMAARLLNVKSEFGKQLDSLADVVSFGVLPGMILFNLLETGFVNMTGVFSYLSYIAFLIPICSALRLAKFNIDTKQTESFIGLPTPANAIFFASIPLILLNPSDVLPIVSKLMGSPYVLIVMIVVFSFLLVSPLPLFSMKFKNFSWSKNSMQYILIGSSVILIIFLHYIAIPSIIILYILLSIIKTPNKNEIPG